MTYFYYYKVKFWLDGEREAEGITYGETWGEVMRHLVEMYGEEDTAEVYLKCFSEGGDCLEFQEMREIKNIEKFWEKEILNNG